MNLEYMTPEILKHILGRIKRTSNEDLLLDTSTSYNDKKCHLMIYNDQKSIWFFDLFITLDNGEEFGLEGSIGIDEFTATNYTNNYENIKIALTEDFSTSMDNGDFFQYSTVNDFHGLTFEQFYVILMIRDEIINCQPKFCVMN